MALWGLRTHQTVGEDEEVSEAQGIGDAAMARDCGVVPDERRLFH